MTAERSVLIVGAGAFGAAGAIELTQRGHRVTLVDCGPLPHPEASSTDVSKAIRMDYGTDEFYARFAAAALERWRAWNAESSEPLFHETGFLVLSSTPLEAGGFEADCYATLTRLGYPLESMDPALLARRFPAFRASRFVDGYYNPQAGWAESGRVVSRLLEQARALGVTIHDGVRFERLLERGSEVSGIVTQDGTSFVAEQVVVAAGAWTAWLLPWLAPVMGPTGQPVLHFRPADPSPFVPPRFAVWGGDIARTGWYGFPLTASGVLKLGHHGPGKRMKPGDALEVSASEEPRFRAFVRETFPDVADAPLERSRLCLYCDTFDGDFWIDRDPEREGLVVACGGSGHAFKFVPVIGEVIADVVEGKPNPWAARFAWREPRERRLEQARFDPAAR